MKDTLSEIGLASSFADLIMECVASCKMKIIWNWEITKEFKMTCDIRQGDPILPYLFVLCIDRLGHLINHTIKEFFLKPIHLSKNGSPIFHLFLADDLILFGVASSEQINVMSKFLDMFLCCSGEKVCKSKSRMSCSLNINHKVESSFSNIMEFILASDLGKYLGVPLHYKGE